MSSSEGSATIDVGKLIDAAGLGRFQISIVVLCGLVAILDGADTTSIAIAASTIAGLLNVPMSAFGLVFAAGTLGAMLGAMTFGPLADRIWSQALVDSFHCFVWNIHSTNCARAKLFRARSVPCYRWAGPRRSDAVFSCPGL